ncbi:phosphorothioated DNA-binding restriction endonuclease [Pseudidiomarina sp.]|uniref:phosphorothioated DNA-binding restriction endonuclease n=1 Tax=Pseudidiomarina sp. TaxID=2081707 RepID=UPI003A9781DF
MNLAELKEAISSVKRWSTGDHRAPNKPLTIAYVLSKYIQGHEQLFSYEGEIEGDVRELLKRFGPPRPIHYPHYAFWRLINDGFWMLENAENCLPEDNSKDASVTCLKKNRVRGGFDQESYQLIRNNVAGAVELLDMILIDNFPETIIPDIKTQLGLSPDVASPRRRDPNFRREVLNAYNGRCAVCGFDGRLNDELFALEAAHIKWKQFNGPCSVDNGLALCVIHHKALDKGVMTIDADYRVKLSSKLNGGDSVDHYFVQYRDKRILLPRSAEDRPKTNMLQWHADEVFLG